MNPFLPMKRLLAAVAVESCLLTAATAASADTINIQFDLSGLPAAIGRVHALDLSAADIGKTSFVANRGAVNVNVATASNQGVVSGSAADLYAAPVSGGSQASPTYWSAPYFSTGLGTITLNFSRAERYLGLLWGSVDHGSTFNYISFNNVTGNRATTVATITGNDIYDVTESNAPNGSQGYGGSFYTVLNDLDGTFNQIVLGSTVVSFEAADIQYSCATVSLDSVPEPASIAVLGTGFLALAAFRRRTGAGVRA
nr:PEP-CTERM sorting domain-containing protein [uncultured Rhodopila sp.]